MGKGVLVKLVLKGERIGDGIVVDDSAEKTHGCPHFSRCSNQRVEC
jgi:hypothetical protein